jgi:hypothetical protein
MIPRRANGRCNDDTDGQMNHESTKAGKHEKKKNGLGELDTSLLRFAFSLFRAFVISSSATAAPWIFSFREAEGRS